MTRWHRKVHFLVMLFLAAASFFLLFFGIRARRSIPQLDLLQLEKFQLDEIPIPEDMDWSKAEVLNWPNLPASTQLLRTEDRVLIRFQAKSHLPFPDIALYYECANQQPQLLGLVRGTQAITYSIPLADCFSASLALYSGGHQTWLDRIPLPKEVIP